MKREDLEAEVQLWNWMWKLEEEGEDQRTRSWTGLSVIWGQVECVRMMWKMGSTGGWGLKRPTSNSWEKAEEEGE